MGLAAALEALPGVKVCAQAATAGEAMEAVAAFRPHAVVVDVSLPRLGGMNLLRALKRLHPGVPTIAVSLENAGPRASEALEAGARAFLLREGAARYFPDALKAARAGRRYVDERLAPRAAAPRRRKLPPAQRAALPALQLGNDACPA